MAKKEIQVITPSNDTSEEETKPSGPPAWMVTFGDAISLLLTFFVLLLSFSTFEESSTKELVSFTNIISTGQAIKGSRFETIQLNFSNTDFDSILEQQKKEDGFNLSEEEIGEELKIDNQNKVNFTIKEFKSLASKNDTPDAMDVEPEQNKLGFTISFGKGSFFRTSTSTLKTSAYPSLEKISKLLGDLPNDIIIKGYANDAPDTDETEAQFQLSIERANKIAAYLSTVARIEPARITITGLGKTEETTTAQTRIHPKQVAITITGTFEGYVLSLHQKNMAEGL